MNYSKAVKTTQRQVARASIVQKSRAFGKRMLSRLMHNPKEEIVLKMEFLEAGEFEFDHG